VHYVSIKCIKFNFGWGSSPDTAGGAYSAPPDPIAVTRGGKGTKGMEGKGLKGEIRENEMES